MKGDFAGQYFPLKELTPEQTQKLIDVSIYVRGCDIMPCCHYFHYMNMTDHLFIPIHYVHYVQRMDDIHVFDTQIIVPLRILVLKAILHFYT